MVLLTDVYCIEFCIRNNNNSHHILGLALALQPKIIFSYTIIMWKKRVFVFRFRLKLLIFALWVGGPSIHPSFHSPLCALDDVVIVVLGFQVHPPSVSQSVSRVSKQSRSSTKNSKKISLHFIFYFTSFSSHSSNKRAPCSSSTFSN